MTYVIFRYKCGRCNDWFEAPQIGEFSYGEFLLRSDTGETRYLNANVDTVFSEVLSFLNNDSRFKCLEERDRSKVFHEVFGSSCDKDSMGRPFIVEAEPVCPRCGKRDSIVYWESTEPPIYTSREIPNVTHNEWNTLNKVEKRFQVEKSLGMSLLRLAAD